MRRKISLYIGERLADISDQSLVLFNYALTDLEKPSAVKNSYSQQITLPASPANDTIFTHAYRLDRIAGGDSFNPLVRTPFTIYSDTGEVVESGYLRLDGVTRKGRVVTGYKVSLFGGLGSFFYNLSYNSEGDKMTLADLEYLAEDDPAAELDFIINKEAVADAWDVLQNGVPASSTSLWHVVNFAPAYEGIPEGNFDASKGLLTAADAGQPATVQDPEGNTYATQGGKVMVSLPEARDEWAVKDLRSYLQRPVFSMRALLEAIARPENNGGYTFDYSGVPASLYERLWKTLPLIPSLQPGHETAGTEPVTLASTGTGAVVIGTYTLDQELDTSHKVNATFSPVISALYTDAGSPQRLYAYARLGGSTDSWMSALFMQMVAEDQNGNPIGGSRVQVVSGIGDRSPKDLATALGYTPVYAAAEFSDTYVYQGREFFSKQSGSTYVLLAGRRIPFNVYTVGAYRWRLYCHAYSAVYSPATQTFSMITGGDTSCPKVFTTNVVISPTQSIDTMRLVDSITKVPYTITGEGRTGATITKAALLASKYSPAEYLIGWAKMNGLLFTCDNASKTVRLHTRNGFYGTGEGVLDLSERIDRSQEITVQPLRCESAWYQFLIDYAQGKFATGYASLYGSPFGIQKVFTGYEFVDAAVNLVDGSPFRGAVTKLDYGRYWNIIQVAGSFRPSVFLDPGTACVYWNSAGKSYANPVNIPHSASVTYYNEYGHPGYDVEFSPKLELKAEDGKGVDGEDILVLQEAFNSYDGFKLSDDTPLMLALNEDVPCWDMDYGSAGISIPAFHRYNDYFETWRLEQSLDYGTPRELAVPDVTVRSASNVYSRQWRAYLADLLDENTKVMRCRVHLDGLRVGPELLRRFFWYEGAVWVLNAINNHSLTTWDATECEFVQVQDVDNYTNGQIY